MGPCGPLLWVWWPNSATFLMQRTSYPVTPVPKPLVWNVALSVPTHPLSDLSHFRLGAFQRAIDTRSCSPRKFNGRETVLCGVAGEVVLGMSYGTQLRGPREGPTWSLQITSLPWQLCWCSGELAGQWPGRRPSVSVASDGTRSPGAGEMEVPAEAEAGATQPAEAAWHHRQARVGRLLLASATAPPGWDREPGEPTPASPDLPV